MGLVCVFVCAASSSSCPALLYSPCVHFVVSRTPVLILVPRFNADACAECFRYMVLKICVVFFRVCNVFARGPSFCREVHDTHTRYTGGLGVIIQNTPEHMAHSKRYVLLLA